MKHYIILATDDILSTGFILTLNDIFGTANMYLSPSVRPENLEHYIWKGIGSHSKKIIVTKAELDELKVNGNSFFLTIVSQNGGDYLLRGNIVEIDQIQ